MESPPKSQSCHDPGQLIPLMFMSKVPASGRLNRELLLNFQRPSVIVTFAIRPGAWLASY